MTVNWSNKLARVTPVVAGVRRLLWAVGRTIDLLRIGGPQALRRRLRHGGVRFRGDYAAWIHRHDRLSERDQRAIIDDIARFINYPLISLWMAPDGHTEARLRRTIGSLRAQLYPHWELQILPAKGARHFEVELCSRLESGDDRIRCIAPGAHPSGSHPARAQQYPGGTYVAAIEPGDVLSRHALYLIAEAVERDSGLDVILIGPHRVVQLEC